MLTCAPHEVTFINNTTGVLKSTWDFGDGTGVNYPGNIINVMHNFKNPGTYNVKINFDNGCSRASTMQQVNVYEKPLAAFTVIKPVVSNNIYCFGDSIFLNITAQTGDFNKLYWGDDANLFYSPPNTSHYYNSTGTYPIKLYAERVNNFGTVCTDSAVLLIKVATKPAISITINIIFACNTYSRLSGNLDKQNSRIGTNCSKIIYPFCI